MDNNDVKNFLNQGIFIGPTVSRSDIKNLLTKLSPYTTQHKLIRLGPNSDGGYLVPDDLQNIKACFSPGVSSYAYFEEDLFQKYRINSFQADFSVEGPPKGYEPISFTKKFIGSYNNDEFITLETWFNNCCPEKNNDDYILQMDIEGGEYDALLSTPDYLLNKFRIILLEVHTLDKWAIKEFYNIANAMIEKLSQNFVLVHNHPNNYSGSISINGVNTPITIELTFHRKDRCTPISKIYSFPHPLDFPNAPHLQDVILPDSFYE